MNEPKINLRQVSTRIEGEDYANIFQLLSNLENGYRDISGYVRKAIHNDLKNVELSDGSKARTEQQISDAASKRTSRRHTRLSFFNRIFGRK